MASKQLGKLRQWAGEVISSKEKTTVSDGFRELERDIELRRDGAQKLFIASDAYHYALSKKKKIDAFEDAEKLLPVDTLGIVMIVHGEEFGHDSAFGTSLVKLGRAHCKVATLQEAFALTFKDTFLASMEKFLDDIKEYEVQRKKLESRRLSYDASVAKHEKLKGGKKEKERREAEDEMQRARERYDETSDEVEAQMHAIQENELVQLRELTSFLDLEINFVEQYLNVLKDVKSDWYDDSNLKPSRSPRAIRPNYTPRPSHEGHGSAQSKHSNRPNIRNSSDSSEVESRRQVPSRSSSTTPRKSQSNISKPPSRSTSRASRNRSDSVGTVGEEEKDKEKDKSRRLSVAGWASSAVGSVRGRGKKGKEKFASLQDDDAEGGSNDDEPGLQESPGKKSGGFHAIAMKLSRDKSRESVHGSPKEEPHRILKPPSLQERKVARALYSFVGAADELSFKAGDEIVVLNEVLDGWWMGELQGNKGLFPTSYVQVVSVKPAIPKRPPSTGSRSKEATSSLSSGDSRRQNFVSDSEDSYVESDLDEHHDAGLRPLAPGESPFYGGPPDAMSVASNVTEDDDDMLSVPITRNAKMTQPSSEVIHHSQSYVSPSRVTDRRDLRIRETPPQSIRRSTTSDLASPIQPPKKAPPPPPPRRSTNNLRETPPVPERPFKSSRTQSAGSLNLKGLMPTPASSASSHSHDRSPFESATELSFATRDGCQEFQQNPFQTKGMCSNCFKLHG